MRFNGRFAYSSGVACDVPPRRRQPAGHPKGPTQEQPRGAIDDQSHRSCGDGADERLGRELVVRGTWCACDSHIVLFWGFALPSLSPRPPFCLRTEAIGMGARRINSCGSIFNGRTPGTTRRAGMSTRILADARRHSRWPKSLTVRWRHPGSLKEISRSCGTLAQTANEAGLMSKITEITMVTIVQNTGQGRYQF